MRLTKAGAYIPVTDFEGSRIAVGGLTIADLIGLAPPRQWDKILGTPARISMDDLPVIIIAGSASGIHHNYPCIKVDDKSKKCVGLTIHAGTTSDTSARRGNQFATVELWCSIRDVEGHSLASGGYMGETTSGLCMLGLILGV